MWSGSARGEPVRYLTGSRDSSVTERPSTATRLRGSRDLLRSRRRQLRPYRINLLAQLVEFPRDLDDLPLRYLVREERVPLAEDVSRRTSSASRCSRYFKSEAALSACALAPIGDPSTFGNIQLIWTHRVSACAACRLDVGPDRAGQSASWRITARQSSPDPGIASSGATVIDAPTRQNPVGLLGGPTRGLRVSKALSRSALPSSGGSAWTGALSRGGALPVSSRIRQDLPARRRKRQSYGAPPGAVQRDLEQICGERLIDPNRPSYRRPRVPVAG